MYEAAYKWTFRVNAPRSLCQRIGAALRRLADLVDRRISLALEIVTTPPIASKERAACVAFGVEQMRWAVEESARAACAEEVLRFQRKEKHGTPA